MIIRKVTPLRANFLHEVLLAILMFVMKSVQILLILGCQDLSSVERTLWYNMYKIDVRPKAVLRSVEGIRINENGLLSDLWGCILYCVYLTINRWRWKEIDIYPAAEAQRKVSVHGTVARILLQGKHMEAKTELTYQSELMNAFENPDPDPVLYVWKKQEKGSLSCLELEWKMKVPLQHEESIEIWHVVVRFLFTNLLAQV